MLFQDHEGNSQMTKVQKTLAGCFHISLNSRDTESQRGDLLVLPVQAAPYIHEGWGLPGWLGPGSRIHPQTNQWLGGQVTWYGQWLPQLWLFSRGWGQSSFFWKILWTGAAWSYYGPLARMELLGHCCDSGVSAVGVWFPPPYPELWVIMSTECDHGYKGALKS